MCALRNLMTEEIKLTLHLAFLRIEAACVLPAGYGKISVKYQGYEL